MFRHTSEDEYQSHSEGGVRHLFELGPYRFQDTAGSEGDLHHCILESAEGRDQATYEVDRDTMYEFMARYLAGEYEIREYNLDRSPAHDALLDVLELATARARSGESDFSWDEFDPGETEVLDVDSDEEPADPEDDARPDG